MRKQVANGCGHDKLVVNRCGCENIGCEYNGGKAQIKLLVNYLLDELDGGMMLDGKFLEAMVVTPLYRVFM